MFGKKTKGAFEFKGPKNKTFGNDSAEDEQEVEEEIPNVQDFIKNMDGAINRARQDEKNATIAGVYSVVSNTSGVKKSFNACGCFSKK